MRSAPGPGRDTDVERRRLFGGLAAIGAALLVPGLAPAAAGARAHPTVLRSTHAAVSPPARDLGSAALDGRAAAAVRSPSPSLVFDGAGDTCSCRPPDPNGDIGARNYVQVVNRTTVSVFSRTGRLRSRFDLGGLWASGPCSDGDGDPNAVYDAFADRWVLTQITGERSGTPAICLAVSRSGNPAGSYFLYEFDTPSEPDYLKVGVWPNAYYLSTSESTDAAYAIDRAKLVAGDANAEAIRFGGETNFLMPASVAGPRRPPPQGGLFYTMKDGAIFGGPDRVELFQLTPDFAAPASSTFRLVRSFGVAPFTWTVCPSFGCIPQRGTTQMLDAVSHWPMYRFAYRRLSGHQALVGSFTVGGGTGGAGAAIRWFELRNGGSGWRLFQQGTQDSRGVDQWMGSIDVDRAGDIALGYSESGPTRFPSVRYATRTPGDPLGTLEPERVLRAGGGSQTGSTRWGDYSSMSVDPVGGCDFWYTQEYYPTTSEEGWRTAIGRFSVPGCARSRPGTP
jgi:hypothetical protein